ncbi:MAG: hypothetical protein FJW31_29305 [Acidobacteria bacterium]|nr:hypothetical protein [Acidobacteriota bacterium]
MNFAKNILLAACFASLAAAQTTAAPAKKAPAKKAAPAAAPAAKQQLAPGSITMPANAVEIEPGLFQAKDAKTGKTWHYRRTPFGVSRFEPQVRKDTMVEEAGLIEITGKEGDTINFERRTPFGKAKWSRKRAELNTAEKMAVARTEAPAPRAAATATKAAK